jgi:pilus assembly protein CpaC
MTSDRAKSRSTIAVCVAAALIATWPASGVRAGDSIDSMAVGRLSDPGARTLQLGVGKSVIVDLPEEAGEIYVGDPKIANAIVRSARRVYVSGVANGQTSIFALARDGRKIATIEVSVGRDVGELSALLNAAIPGNEIHVRTVADKIILTGSVASAEEAQKALDIASGFVDDLPAPSSSGAGGVSISVGSSGGAPSGSGGNAANGSRGKVINSLTIRGLDQVSLHVTVAEIRREIVKQLGVNMSGSGPNGSVTLDNPFAINGAVATSEGILNWVKGNQSFSATLQAFERQGVAHTLAEPTVTAISGESAKFLAGGTVPIVSGESCSAGSGCTPTLVQQPYGVTLNFTPVVLSEGRIQLRIATEVTDVDYSTQISYLGISVPGFRTRNNTTTVELPSGGSIASAGLISTQTQQAVNGFPALMNLPVLGALFRSRDYLRNETELMIVVTPYIVHAIDPNQIVRPDQNFQDASDPQTWFLGRVNRIYSTSESLQPMPGYAGKIGFITQ